MKKRTMIIQLFINLMLLIFMGYLFFIQVFDFDNYKQRGVAIRTTEITTELIKVPR